MANTNKPTYRDYAGVGIESDHNESFCSDQDVTTKPASFPSKLYMMVSCPQNQDIITWLPHGRAWKILNQKEFETKVLPRYFKHGRISSFKRQLNGYGFRKIISGVDYGGYCHELFLRGMPHLCSRVLRLVKSGKMNDHSRKDIPIPDFYALSRDNPLPEISSTGTEKTSDKPSPTSCPVARNNISSNEALKCLEDLCTPTTLMQPNQTKKEEFTTNNPLASATSMNVPLIPEQAPLTLPTCNQRDIQNIEYLVELLKAKNNHTQVRADTASLRQGTMPMISFQEASHQTTSNLSENVASSAAQNIGVSSNVQPPLNQSLNQDAIQALANLFQIPSAQIQPSLVLPASHSVVNNIEIGRAHV